MILKFKLNDYFLLNLIDTAYYEIFYLFRLKHSIILDLIYGLLNPIEI